MARMSFLVLGAVVAALLWVVRTVLSGSHKRRRAGREELAPNAAMTRRLHGGHRARRDRGG